MAFTNCCSREDNPNCTIKAAEFIGTCLGVSICVWERGILCCYNTSPLLQKGFITLYDFRAVLHTYTLTRALDLQVFDSLTSAVITTDQQKYPWNGCLPQTSTCSAMVVYACSFPLFIVPSNFQQVVAAATETSWMATLKNKPYFKVFVWIIKKTGK